ncbi:trigger factor [Endomicrobium proavitum]|uniref:Trigger factor n=1 Tax=Endomicrobium proavitum TaxID=1408281 RepID=A0A0G3WGC9_9BACT|nr:trigger factor [Endomicrobium proavitum]AKL97721.1 peptidyl-prolyl cis/trans isomerase (trigger factor) [Endomicrobium proavitum]
MSQESKKIDYKSSVVTKKSCSITIDVEVSADIAAKEIEAAYGLIQKQAKIDGFRHGKAPISVVKEKFSKEAKDRAVENVVKATVFDALTKENFTPIDFPVVDEFDYELGQVFKYRFSAECHPVVEIKDYKEIPVKKEIFKVTDKSLAQSLDALRDRNAKLVPSKTGVVKEDSFVSVDYDAFDKDGNAIPSINAKNHLLDLGSQDTVKGFQKALKGAKIGDEEDAKVEYPADYPNKTLAGKTVTFKTKVVEIKEKELPELNDDFAKDLGAENLEDLKKKVTEAVEAEEKRRQDIDVEKQVMDYLLSKNKFDVPKTLVDGQKQTLVERMAQYMKNQGAPQEYINKQAELGDKKFEEEAERTVRLSYILNAIYAKENLTVTDADFETAKQKMKDENPQRAAAVDKYFAEKKENIGISIKEEKLFKFLLDNAKIKEEVKDMPLKKD